MLKLSRCARRVPLEAIPDLLLDEARHFHGISRGEVPKGGRYVLETQGSQDHNDREELHDLNEEEENPKTIPSSIARK